MASRDHEIVGTVNPTVNMFGADPVHVRGAWEMRYNEVLTDRVEHRIDTIRASLLHHSTAEKELGMGTQTTTIHCQLVDQGA